MITNIINSTKYSIKSGQILAFFIGVAYLVGILSFLHLVPSERDINLGFQMTIIVSFGMILVWGNKHFKLKSIGWSAAIWIYMVLILMLQPAVNNIVYEDALIFVITSMLFMLMLSITVYNIKDKKIFVTNLAVFLFIGAILHLLTQLAHLFYWDFLFNSFVLPIPKGERPTGNIAQPNQAAFIYAMGISSALYLGNKYSSLTKKNILVARLFVFVSLLIFSVGVAICGSRGGLVLSAGAIITYIASNNMALKNKIVLLFSSFAIFAIGYVLGSDVLESYSGTQTVVNRIISHDAPLRLYHLQQAWLIFLDNPVFGIGWRNFAAGGLQHFEDLSWFYLINHSHFIISQIASELGVIGLLVLIPFAYIIFKNVSFKSETHNALAFSIIAVITLYSCSEFPLWYFSYLMVFATFLGLIDVKFKTIYGSFKKLFIPLSFAMILGSIYYYDSFMRYSYVAEMVMDKKTTLDKKINEINSLNTPYGFLQFKEVLLFMSLPVSSDHIELKLDIGKRVTKIYTSPQLLIKQGFFLALNDESNEALLFFKAACVYDFGRKCDTVNDGLAIAKKSESEKFEPIYRAFTQWRRANPEKTGLKVVVDVSEKNIKD